MKSIRPLLLTVLGVVTFVFAKGQSWEDYLFYDTYRHTKESLLNGPTYFSDISDSGVIVGHFLHHSAGNVGLVRYRNGDSDTLAIDGYANTEITGINNKHQIVGRAYNSPSTAVAFKAEIVNRKIVNATVFDWHSSGARNKWPHKINDDGIASGSLETGTTRWTHYQKVFGSSTASDKTTRHRVGSTWVNTYGTGVNENLDMVGYYIDGSERFPFLYSTTNNKIYTLDHVYPQGRRTIVNDINNKYQIAVEYRDSTGFMHSTIGQYNPADQSVMYYDTFPLNDVQQTYIKGINNNGDIVGYYINSSGITRAFFATKSAMEIPGFDIAKHAIPHANSAPFFQYDTFDYDYIRQDPYFRDTTQPFYKAITDHIPLDSFKEKSLRDARRSPSWSSYVLAKGADKCYIGGQLRVIEAIKWLSISSDSFQGFCNGISGMTGQFFVDTQSVYKRFPFIPNGNTLSDYNLTNKKFDLRFRESLGALQMYQMSKHLRKVLEPWNDQVWYYQTGQHTTHMDNIREMVTDMATDFYDSSAIDSLNLLYEWISFNQTFNPGGHAVFPYKIHRRLSLAYPVDTVYVMDPNFPQTPIKIAFKYDDLIAWAFDGNNQFRYNVLTAGPGGNLAQINIPSRAKLRPKRQDSKDNQHMKSSVDEATINTFGICEYSIENVDKASEKIELTGGKFTNTFADITADYIMNSDDKPDVLTSSKPLNIKSTISGCTGSHFWHYMHPDGDLIYARKGVKPTEQDVIYNQGKTMRVVNQEGVDGTITVTSITEKEDEEAVVTIEDFTLSKGKELSIDATDIYHVKIDNSDGENSGYTLKVRYIAEDETVNWKTTDVKIGKDQTHTVLLKPEDEDREVRILVDTTGDGNADDTLVIQNNSSIENVLLARYDVKMYPNPASKTLHLSMQNLQSSSTTFKLLDVQGKVVFEKEIQHGASIQRQFNVAHLARGVYTAEIITNDRRSTIRNKVVLK